VSSQIEKERKCFWYCSIFEGILFILPDGVIHFYQANQPLQEMIKETYRNKTYYRFPSSSKRIAQSTIRRKAMRCNVLLCASSARDPENNHGQGENDEAEFEIFNLVI